MVSSLFVSVSVCFTAALSMAAPSKRTVGSMVGRPRRQGSPKYIRLRESGFLIPGEMGKKLLAVNSTDSMFDFLRRLKRSNSKKYFEKNCYVAEFKTLFYSSYKPTPFPTSLPLSRIQAL